MSAPIKRGDIVEYRGVLWRIVYKGTGPNPETSLKRLASTGKQQAWTRLRNLILVKRSDVFVEEKRRMVNVRVTEIQNGVRAVKGDMVREYVSRASEEQLDELIAIFNEYTQEV
jgi:hypothetical protein